jgi:hypothetical protein
VMSGMEGRVAAAIARMEQVRREMAERRVLRQRHGAEIRAKSLENLKKHAAEAQQVAKDLGERARRQQAAGGWSTSAVERDRTHVLGLGVGDEDAPRRVAPPAYRPPPAPPERTPPPPERTPPPAPRRPARPRPPEDEDDLSGHTWMIDH